MTPPPGAAIIHTSPRPRRRTRATTPRNRHAPPDPPPLRARRRALEDRANPVSFGATTSYEFGSNSTAVGTGDFNGDGKSDLAVASYTNGVQVLLNNGTGSFTASATIAASDPRAVRVADMNGDGKADVVVAAGANYQVFIALGNGNGTFQAPIRRDVGGGALDIAIADFNGDGKPDVAVAAGSLVVMPNDGSVYVLGVPSYYQTNGDGESIAVGDFNGDGKPDVALGGYSSNRVDVLLNNGDGTFTASAAGKYSVGGHVGDIQAGDLNHDGHPDLVVSYGQGSKIAVLLGKADGTFGAATEYAAGFGSPGRIALADVDGDGNTDAVVTFLNNATGLFLGNGAGGLASPISVPKADHPTDVAAVDVTGDSLPDVVTTSSDSPGNVSVAPNTTPHVAAFTVSAPAHVTAGVPFTVTVTARDQNGAALTGYTGTAHFTTSDGQGVLPADAAFIASDNGVKTFSVTLGSAGMQSVTVADATLTTAKGSANTTVDAGAATHLSVSAPASVAAGTGFAFTVTARDAFNNTATGYAGTAHFASSDGAAVLPADATLTGGTGSFMATLKTAGGRTITATDTAAGSVAGTSGTITVTPGAATHFAVTAPASATAGVGFAYTVTAFDAFNNTATGYAGTAHFASTDAAATVPADAGLAGGVGTFTATLRTAGGQTLSATDTAAVSVAGVSGTIIVTPGAVTHFGVSASASATAGVGFAYTVTALDGFGNVATGYAGTAHFTSTDAAAVLPADTTLAGGTGSFGATLRTAGSQTLSATDTATGAVAGTSGAITVSPGAATHFGMSAPASATAGVGVAFGVTALDGFGNTATGYAGTAHFTSTDPAAALPADATLTNGTGSVSATLKTAGGQTLSATDTAAGSVTGTSGTITVTPGAATRFAVSAPASAAAGVGFAYTVTALDGFGNVATGYAGTAHFTSTDAAAVLPADTTLAGGTGSFGATLRTAGSQTLSATDTATGAVAGTSGAITVSPGAATHFGMSAARLGHRRGRSRVRRHRPGRVRQHGHRVRRDGPLHQLRRGRHRPGRRHPGGRVRELHGDPADGRVADPHRHRHGRRVGHRNERGDHRDAGGGGERRPDRRRRAVGRGRGRVRPPARGAGDGPVREPRRGGAGHVRRPGDRPGGDLPVRVRRRVQRGRASERVRRGERPGRRVHRDRDGGRGRRRRGRDPDEHPPALTNAVSGTDRDSVAGPIADTGPVRPVRSSPAGRPTGRRGS